MAKTPRKRRVDADDVDERRAHGDEANDPLGKLWQQYRVTLAGVLIVSALIACVGAALIVYGLSGQPYSLFCLVFGAGMLLCSVALIGVNVLNIGRHLEIRKRGIRFTESGAVTELLWDEIVDIEVNRLDDTNLGVVSVYKRGSNASALSGLLTKTEWDVTIHGNDGRRIRLPPMFFRVVRDPKKLISQLRLRAGI
jgi:hypothetical protein